MTFKQLPEETKEKIKKIYKEGSIKDNMRYLLEVYYKNIAFVNDWEKELGFAVGCANCQIRVKRYFARNLNA